MDELRFVLKCFAFAAVLLVFSQLKTKNGTIETEIQGALVNSQTASFVNKAAAGGAEFLRDAGAYLKNKLNGAQKSAHKNQAVEHVFDVTEKTTAKLNGVIENKKTALKQAVSETHEVDLIEETVEEIE